MALGGANVWSNFSYGIRIDTPKGCLLNAEGSRLIFFERSRKSPKNNVKIFIHLFYTNHLGEPAGLKSTNQLNLDEAWVQWHELQEHGWTEVAHNFG
ncbi:possible Phosphatidylinositol-specific phospholipase [Prochlorococcus marinus str. MIT 9515]|uniref:Possible Phosphatidylinositol-specific phospholipase n=1 Tax=Prochlorococcus marinus (strain MIT 9515) TaxID=167542 RepID=A2BXI7_PROM5|nr:DUF1651 domain-containing protein [Prochlorococcus marinus]ABM72498.1 possible Phosphatidylinositol-specific phospholipase [Prochlorococcus marinus str. MIT 9515]